MHVEQAIFTSADGDNIKGYQLVARSSGIDRRLAQQLCRWAPSHESLWGEESESWSLNYFPAGEDWLAITRTMYGGPEYSNRGGIRVVTTMLAVRVQQFAAYEYDAFSLARTALALGHLRLMIDPAEQLPSVQLPDFPIMPPYHGTTGSATNTASLSGIRDLLVDDRRVAVAQAGDPVAALAELLALMPPERRLEISFTTGLRPSAQRAFRLHFLPEPDAAMRRSLQAQGIVCVSGVRAD